MLMEVTLLKKVRGEMYMEFRDLKAQYKALKAKIDSAVLEVMTNGNFIMGRQIIELENDLAEYVGVKHCITCANGTDALTMVLMAWQIQKGHAVFVPDFTFFASGEVVSLRGATPVFVDVDTDTFNINPKKLEEAITRIVSEGKLIPKAIIAVDLFGLPANYSEIAKIAKKYHLLVLEDGAQGFGGKINNRCACSFGDAATTSFFPAKPLGCYGDGGAIFTNDDDVAEYIKSIRAHGKAAFKYDNIRIGVNSRLDTIQAAILKPKFQAFKEYELENVNKAAKVYTEKLKDLVKTPFIPQGYTSSWAQYTIILSSDKQRNDLQKALKEKDIPTIIYYPKPMHMQKAFSNLSYKSGDFLVAEMLCNCVLSLPIHPYLTEKDIEYVNDSIRQFFNQ